jgi:hypothetical protein
MLGPSGRTFERSAYDFFFFLKLKLVLSGERKVGDMFMNGGQFGLDLLSSKQRVSRNTSSNDQSLNSLHEVGRELLQRGQHGIDSSCNYSPLQSGNYLITPILYLRPLSIITS